MIFPNDTNEPNSSNQFLLANFNGSSITNKKHLNYKIIDHPRGLEIRSEFFRAPGAALISKQAASNSKTIRQQMAKRNRSLGNQSIQYSHIQPIILTWSIYFFLWEAAAGSKQAIQAQMQLSKMSRKILPT